MKSRIVLGLIMGSILLAIFGVSPQHRAYMLQTNTGNNLFPAWSPDGRYIAYASDADGNFDIWRLDVNNFEKLNLTQAMPDGAYSEPAWSPDGEYIAFTSNTEIWVIESDGSNPTKLELPVIDYVFSPQWSPDGRYIGFLSFEPAGGNVWIFDRDHSVASNITNFGNPYLIIALPKWSPDSTKIAFSFIDNSKPIGQGGSQIGVVDVTNLDISLTSEYMYTPPNWSPDGKKLITVLTDLGSSDDELDSLVTLNSATLLVENYLTDKQFSPSLVLASPVWSPDENLIIYTRLQENEEGVYDHDLWVMSANGSNHYQLTDFDDNEPQIPVWSPDAKQIAFQLLTVSGSDIWLINADGSNPINLTGQE
ncbi:MAG: PD40 domain-containing protein [Chloroflexi bacterium]|nr:PD40 domain-containing protein [Chloroflexota bacterium]